MSTATVDKLAPRQRFSPTMRITAMELALRFGLHLVRDNFHMWAIRKSDKVQVWLCSSPTYDGLWRETIKLFNEPGFDPSHLPYMIGETDSQVVMYDPMRKKDEREYAIDKADLRKHRSAS